MNIAIVGVAGRFPEAENVNKFLNNLLQKKDSIRTVSDHRLRNTSMPTDKDYQIFGYMDDIEFFDHDFFGISLGEARQIDPQQRILLELTYNLFENAGYNPFQFDGNKTGVFLGAVKNSYSTLARNMDPTLVTGTLDSLATGRIARHFNLRKSALLVDTACSSSLVALHYACQSMSIGELDYAIVGGANLTIIPPSKSNDQMNIGIMSPDGKAKAFAKDANGTSLGEAIGLILLKPLVNALDDEDLIHAVIRSSAVNQDANLSSSLLSPSFMAQSEVLIDAWQKAGVDPSTIGYIETHGTGTKLGDPIEIQGIDEAFKKFTNKKEFCSISSLKSNIGHTDTASGISGLIKAVLSLKYKTLFSSLHVSHSNPLINFNNSATYISRETSVWEKLGANPRRAGVSSFGVSGTNCHVLMEEAPERKLKSEPIESESDFLITISAKKRNILQKNMWAIYDHLVSNKELKIEDVSYTLNCGRKHFPYRYTTTVGSTEKLIEKLGYDLHNQSPVMEFKPDQLIYIFSHDSNYFPSADIQAINKIPAFKSTLNECLKILKVKEPNEACRYFIFRLSLYRSLKSLGINPTLIIGTGFGELLSKVVTNQMPLEKALTTVSDGQEYQSRQLEKKCIELLDRFSGEKVLFVEVGFQAAISKMISKKIVDQKKHQLISLNYSSGFWIQLLELMYLRGVDLNWQDVYLNGQGKKVEIPGYQFQRTRCWLADQYIKDIKEWFYKIEWISQPELPEEVKSGEGYYLIFHDNDSLGQEVAVLIRSQGAKTIMVRFGDFFLKSSPEQYIFNPENSNNFIQLAQHLENDQLPIKGIINLYGYQQTKSNREAIDILSSSLIITQRLIKYLNSWITKNQFDLVLVFNDLKDIVSGTFRLPAIPSAMLSLIKSISLEYPKLNPHFLHFSATEKDGEKNMKRLVQSLSFSDLCWISVFHKGHRWQPALKSHLWDSTDELDLNQLDNQGNYLIIGGTGGIGTKIAEHLINLMPNCQLILTGNTILPNEKTWMEYLRSGEDNKVKEKISIINELRRKGGDVKFLKVDITEKRDIEQLVNYLNKNAKELQLVFNCAGVKEKLIPLIEKSEEDLLAPVNTKVKGILLLDQALQAFKAKRMIQCSSIGSIAPTYFTPGYAAANGFIDGYCDGRVNYLSINWPGWFATGMSQKANDKNVNKLFPMLSRSEGILALDMAIKQKNSNLMVCNIREEFLNNNPYFIRTEEGLESDNKAASTASTLSNTPSEITESAARKEFFQEGLTDTENRIMKIWYEVLEAEYINISDDFFEIGGHSLNGTKIINRMEQEFNCEIEFETLYDHGTVQALAEYMESLLDQNYQGSVQKIPNALDKPYYPLSFAQTRFWVLHQYDREKYIFNLPEAFEIYGDLDIRAFTKSFETLVDRHESLRTTYITIDGEPMQKINSSEELSIHIDLIDLMRKDEPEQEAIKLTRQEYMFEFDLQKGPLIRLRLFRLKKDAYVFIINLHHIVSDGWSMQLLVSEFWKLYDAYVNHKPNPLPPLRIQYKDYTLWQKQKLKDDKLKKLKHYWQQTFKNGIPSLSLFYDQEPDDRNSNGKTVPLKVETQLTQQIRSHAVQKNVSLFTIIIANLKLLLHFYSGEQEIVVGTPIAGRNHVELENQIGLYLNTLPIKTSFSVYDTLDEYFNKVRSAVEGAFENQSYPLDLLVDDLNIQSKKGRLPLFNVVLVMQQLDNITQQSVDGSAHELEVRSFKIDKQSTTFDLTIRLVEVEGSIQGSITFKEELFKDKSIAEFINRLKYILMISSSHGNQAIYQFMKVIDEFENSTDDNVKVNFDF